MAYTKTWVFRQVSKAFAWQYQCGCFILILFLFSVLPLLAESPNEKDVNNGAGKAVDAEESKPVTKQAQPDDLDLWAELHKTAIAPGLLLSPRRGLGLQLNGSGGSELLFVSFGFSSGIALFGKTHLSRVGRNELPRDTATTGTLYSTNNFLVDLSINRHLNFLNAFKFDFSGEQQDQAWHYAGDLVWDCTKNPDQPFDGLMIRAGDSVGCEQNQTYNMLDAGIGAYVPLIDSKAVWTFSVEGQGATTSLPADAAILLNGPQLISDDTTYFGLWDAVHTAPYAWSAATGFRLRVARVQAFADRIGAVFGAKPLEEHGWDRGLYQWLTPFAFASGLYDPCQTNIPKPSWGFGIAGTLGVVSGPYTKTLLTAYVGVNLGDLPTPRIFFNISAKKLGSQMFL